MRKVKIAVIGGGITGRLVQIQIPTADVFDWKPEPTGPKGLIRNFGANYLWTPLPGIECREFTVETRIDGQIPTLASARIYKDKIGKGGDIHQGDDLLMRQFQPTMTGYDFATLPPTSIQFNYRATEVDRINRTITFSTGKEVQYDFLVSTIPFYSLLSLLGMPEPSGKLQFKPIFFKVVSRPPDAPFPPDVMYVNYISDANIVPYRYCDRDGERHYESIIPYPGAISSKRFAPGKIYPHPDVPDVLEYLAGFGIQTFGRFGSWNPDELVHETWAHIAEWKENIG